MTTPRLQVDLLVWRVAAMFLLVATAALWLSFIYLVQLDIRLTMRGSPGEHSPLRLALHGLPAALAATACFAAAYKASRAKTGRLGVAGGSCLGLLAASTAVLLLLPSYLQTLSEFATLPWNNWSYSR